ncbi:MAG: sulfur carrier protein ThiS [Proteobacteria bacterium]|nr:sulfur carrier protein ThiS [Pseudomonadota bacterium]
MKTTRVLVNGAWRETGAADLGAALCDFGYGDSIVSTAVNGEFVAATARTRTPVTEGDRIEVLAPMQGG